MQQIGKGYAPLCNTFWNSWIFHYSLHLQVWLRVCACVCASAISHSACIIISASRSFSVRGVKKYLAVSEVFWRVPCLFAVDISYGRMSPSDESPLSHELRFMCSWIFGDSSAKPKRQCFPNWCLALALRRDPSPASRAGTPTSRVSVCVKGVGSLDSSRFGVVFIHVHAVVLDVGRGWRGACSALVLESVTRQYTTYSRGV